MEKLLTTSEAASLANVNSDTIRRWDKNGFIDSVRTDGGHRRYSESSLLNYLNKISRNIIKKNIIYTRVQASGNKAILDEQIDLLKSFAKTFNLECEVMWDIGCGMNYSRKGFSNLVNLIENNMVESIFILSSSNLMTFGFEFFEQICNAHGVKIYSLYKDAIKETNDDILQYFVSFGREVFHNDEEKYLSFLKNVL